MGIGEFFSSYLSYPFWVVHLITWIVAGFTLLRHRTNLASIVANTRPKKQIDPTTAAQDIEEAERPYSVYDLCSNVFILVGLIGTIYGFYAGMRTAEGDISLPKIAPALATSAFGIIWAVVLSVIIKLTIEPGVDDIRRLHRSRVSGNLGIQMALTDIGHKFDDSLIAIKETVHAINHQVEAVFSSGSKTFAEATKDMAEAARSLADTVTASSSSFERSIAQAKQTTDKLDAILQAALELPMKVGEQLGHFTEAHVVEMHKFSQSLTGDLGSLAVQISDCVKDIKEVPSDVRKELAATHEEYVRRLSELTTVVGSYGEKLQQSLNDLYRSHEVLLASAVQHLRGEIDSIVSLLASQAHTTSQLHNQIVKDLEQTQERYLAVLDESLRGMLSRYQELLAQNSTDAKERATELLKAFAGVTDAISTIPERVEENARLLSNEFIRLLREQHEEHTKQLEKEAKRIWTKATDELGAAAGKVEGACQALGGTAKDLSKTAETAYGEQTKKVSEEVKLLFGQVDQLVAKISGGVVEALRSAPSTMEAQTTIIRDELQKLTVAAGACGEQAAKVSKDVRVTLQSVEEDLQALDPAVKAVAAAVGRIKEISTSDLQKPSPDHTHTLGEIKETLAQIANDNASMLADRRQGPLSSMGGLVKRMWNQIRPSRKQ